MATGQRLRGLVAQTMSGRRRPPTSYTYNFPPGSSTWTCPAPGWWRIALWGGGGSADNSTTTGGGGGGFYMADRLFVKGQVVTLSVGNGGKRSGPVDGGDTTATLPGGEILVANGGVSGASTGAGGAPTANRSADTARSGGAGGVNSAGSAGSGTGGGVGGTGGGGVAGGGGAGGELPYRGANGQNSLTNDPGRCPGGGGSIDSGIGGLGGDGQALISRVRFAV